MSRWFRHYAGMMRDDKLVSAAIRSKQTVERVVWVWGAILESAAEIDDGGRYDLDPAECAYFLRADETDIAAIVGALEVSNRLSGNTVANWGDRQFQSDRSAERQRRYREKKAGGEADGKQAEPMGVGDDADVTSLSRHGDAPETETELDTEKNPPKPPRKRRGEGKTILPEDWVLPSVADLPDKARACAEQWTSASYETHGEAFMSYWRSSRKMMGDWRLTWANRIVTLHSQVMRDQKFGNAPAASAKPLTEDEQRTRQLSTAETYERIGRTDEAAEIRRRWATGPPRSIGDLVGKITREGVGNGKA